MKKMIMMLKKQMMLPSPSNISMWWNMGSMLGLCLMMQTMSGVILSMNYCPNTEKAFQSTISIMNNNWMGWISRNLHINGASMFFMLMYIHITRGIFFFSFKKKNTWIIGNFILIVSMATAFLGYVLPWGQMSFWGATVITNLISAIPYLGQEMVEWIWGGKSINNATLNRFYSIHFIMPAMIMLLVMLHLMQLHKSGSSNPLGVNSKHYMIPLNPYFMMKDYLGFLIMLMMLMMTSTMTPTLLMDPDNFIKSNPLITPPHIKPEWYFLFAYAILRSIPSKLGGVIMLITSIMIIMILSMYKLNKNSMKFSTPTKIMYWTFISSIMLLTWLGGKPIEYPYNIMAQLISIWYFIFFILFPIPIKLTKMK